MKLGAPVLLNASTLLKMNFIFIVIFSDHILAPRTTLNQPCYLPVNLDLTTRSENGTFAVPFASPTTAGQKWMKNGTSRQKWDRYFDGMGGNRTPVGVLGQIALGCWMGTSTARAWKANDTKAIKMVYPGSRKPGQLYTAIPMTLKLLKLPMLCAV